MSGTGDMSGMPRDPVPAAPSERVADTPSTERPDAGGTAERAVRTAQRRRLDDVFGEVLPEVTEDERDAGGEPLPGADRDRWYLENRPPHHG